MITKLIQRSVIMAGIDGKLSDAIENLSELFRENSYVQYDVISNPEYEKLEKEFPDFDDRWWEALTREIESELIVVRRGKWMWDIGSLFWKLNWLLWTRFKL